MNNPFDRTIINPLEKPLSSDINQTESQLDYSLRFMAQQLLPRRTSDTNESLVPAVGFMPYSMKVVPSAVPDLNVTVKQGLAYFYDVTDTPSGIDGIDGLNDQSPYKPIVLMADTVFAVPTPPGLGNSRIDIIEARFNRQADNPQSRLILNTLTGAFVPDTVNKTLSFTLDGSVGYVVSPAPSTVALSYKQGVAAASGTEIEPTVTPGYVQIARINVGPLAATVPKGNIVDRRTLLGTNGTVQAGINWFQEWNAGVPTAAIRSVVGPPNVEFGLALDNGSGAHNAGGFFVTGLGQFTKAIVLLSARGHSPTFGDVNGVLQNAGFSGNTQILGAADATMKSNFAGAYIPLIIGVGQQVIAVGYGAFKASTGSNSAATLDALYWDAMVFASYQ